MSSLPHPYGQPRKLRRSCDFCTTSKLKCSQEKPACQRCVRSGREATCFYSETRPPGRPKRPARGSFDDSSYTMRHQHREETNRTGSLSSNSCAELQTPHGNEPGGFGKRRRLEDATGANIDPLYSSAGLSVGDLTEGDFANVDYDPNDSDIFDLMVEVPNLEDAGCSSNGPDSLFDDFDITWAQANMNASQEGDALALSERDSSAAFASSMVTPESMITETLMSSERPTELSIARPWDFRCARMCDRDVQVAQQPFVLPRVSQSDDDHSRQHVPSGHNGSQQDAGEWSRSISALTSTLLAPQASDYLPTRRLSLDTLLCAEQTLLRAKQGLETSNTPNSELIICSLMGLWLDKLKTQLRELYYDESEDRDLRRRHGLEARDDLPPDPIALRTEMHVGASKLSGRLMRDCVRVMLKRRLRNHIQIFGRTMQVHSDSSKALIGSVRLATTAVIDEVESLLGMLNL